MDEGNIQKPILLENLKYNGDFSAIIKLQDLRFQAIVNAVAATHNIKHAALELGVSEKSVIDFCGENKISHRVRLQMRAHFSTLDVKIKYNYDYGERSRSYRNGNDQRTLPGLHKNI